MPKFYDVSVSPSVSEIDAAVLQNGGILDSRGYGFDCPKAPAEKRVGDWEIQLVDRRGMGNHGSTIAIACTQRAFEAQKKATMSILRRWADEAETAGEAEFKERGDFACAVIPLLWSPFAPKKGHFLFSDEKWSYFSHPHGNYLRVGDDRSRFWVRPVRRQKAHD